MDAADSEQEAGDAEEEFETDPKRLVARQKQVDYGKNTIGYENYLKAVPKYVLGQLLQHCLTAWIQRLTATLVFSYMLHITLLGMVAPHISQYRIDIKMATGALTP